VRVLLLRWYVVQWWRLWVSSNSEEIDSISHCPALCNHHLPLDSFVPGVTRQAVAHLRPRGGLALLYDTPRCVQLLSTYVKAWLSVTYCWDGVHPLGFKRDLFMRTSPGSAATQCFRRTPHTATWDYVNEREESHRQASVVQVNEGLLWRIGQQPYLPIHNIRENCRYLALHQCSRVLVL